MNATMKVGLSSRTVACNCNRKLSLPASRRAFLPVRAQAVSTSYTTTDTTTTNGNGNGVAGYAPAAAPQYAPAEILAPQDAYMYVAKDGAKKAEMTPFKTFVKALYAGAYIGFGAFLGSAVCSNLPGITASNPGLTKLIFALLFPVGLTMNTLHGAELFTGNTMKLPAAIYEGKATFGQLVKNWFYSYTGNFVGSLALVAAVVASGVLAGAAFPVKLAAAKATLPWSQAFIRAILANWLVCVAVWCSGAATSLPGKVMGIWPPIAAFVAIGLEHSVANMFIIPLGIALGAEVSFSHFLTNNLLPVTLGNIVGGLVFMGTASSIFFGSLGKPKTA